MSGHVPEIPSDTQRRRNWNECREQVRVLFAEHDIVSILDCLVREMHAVSGNITEDFTREDQNEVILLDMQSATLQGARNAIAMQASRLNQYPHTRRTS